MTRLLTSLLVSLTALVAMIAPASAQPCCTATGATEVSVVGRCHQSVLASQLSYERGLAYYDADGERSFRDDAANDVILTVGGGTRLGWDRLQVHGGIPLRLQQRQSGTNSSTAWGIGDAAFELRFTPLYDAMGGIGGEASSFLPFVDVFAGVKMPTGRAPEDARDSTLADVTSDGAWAATGGVRLTKFVTTSDIVSLQLDLVHAFARDIPTPTGELSLARGLQTGTRLGYTRLFNLFWSAGGHVDLRLRGPTALGDADVPDSESRRVMVGAHVTRVVAFPYWEVTLAAATDTLLPEVARNVLAAGPTASLTLRRTFP